MTSLNNNPSIDPVNQDNLAGSILFAFNKLMQSVDGCLPAHIMAYDRNTNRAQVQIDIAILTTENEIVPRPQIASIPVMQFGGGGYMLNFPINSGDKGWIIANDRDISLFLQDYKSTYPNTGRIKNFSNGVFIPDIMSGYTINAEDTGNAVLSSIDGTIRISLFPDKIKITAPKVIIDGMLEVTGEITAGAGISVSGGTGDTITVSGNLQLTGEFNQLGNMVVDGNISATGTITPGV